MPVLDAPGVVGLVVTGVGGGLDDGQPAAAATRISAVAAKLIRPVAGCLVVARPIQKSTVPEYLALDHTGVPFLRAAPHAPFSNYHDNAGTVVAAASTPGWPGPYNKPGPRHHGHGPAADDLDFERPGLGERDIVVRGETQARSVKSSARASRESRSPAGTGLRPLPWTAT